MRRFLKWLAPKVCRVLGHDEFTGFSFEKNTAGYRCYRCGQTRYVDPRPTDSEGGKQ